MWDRLKSEAIRHGINIYLSGKYGKVTSLHIDNRQKRISASMLLNGEQNPVDFTVGEYYIDESDPACLRVFLRKVTVSRGWMQELVADHVENKPIHLPEQVTAAVKSVL